MSVFWKGLINDVNEGIKHMSRNTTRTVSGKPSEANMVIPPR